MQDRTQLGTYKLEHIPPIIKDSVVSSVPMPSIAFFKLAQAASRGGSHKSNTASSKSTGKSYKLVTF
jgi:hypothetical protein